MGMKRYSSHYNSSIRINRSIQLKVNVILF